MRTDADDLEDKNGREELQNDEQGAEKRRSEPHSLKRESVLKEESPEDQGMKETLVRTTAKKGRHLNPVMMTTKTTTMTEWLKEKSIYQITTPI